MDTVRQRLFTFGERPRGIQLDGGAIIAAKGLFHALKHVGDVVVGNNRIKRVAPVHLQGHDLRPGRDGDFLYMVGYQFSRFPRTKVRQ